MSDYNKGLLKDMFLAFGFVIGGLAVIVGTFATLITLFS